MTRKTFLPIAAAVLLSALVASPVSQAYFPVSLPASTLTMSGSDYSEQVSPPADESQAASAVAAPEARKPRPEPSPRRNTLRAAGAWLKALVR